MTNSLRTWKWPIESSLIDLLKMVIFQFAVLVYQGGLPEGKLIFQGNPIQNVHRKNGEANGMEWGGFSAIILEIFGHWTSHKWVAERCHPWVVDHFSHVQMNRPFWNRCKAFDLLWIIQLIIDPSISILTNIRIVTLLHPLVLLLTVQLRSKNSAAKTHQRHQLGRPCMCGIGAGMGGAEWSEWGGLRALEMEISLCLSRGHGGSWL